MTTAASKPIRAPRPRKAREQTMKSLLKEKHIQETIVDFLKLDGWRAFRTELTVQRERGRVVGERGQPDYQFLRYRPTHEHYPLHPCLNVQFFNQALAEILWIEFKRHGEKPKSDQLAWHAAEKNRGALVMVVDDIDSFLYWYRTRSGLMRRKI
jgi:hypothetical protein